MSFVDCCCVCGECGALVWHLDVAMCTSGWARLRASFAARSADLFPGIPMRDGIQAMTGGVCSFWVAS